MNKSSFLTMVAASLVCGAAFAQAPTVYGVADLSVDSASATGAATATNDVPTRTRLQANSSLLGIKGKFDLGGGTAAIYQFETYVDLGSNQAGANMATPIATTTTVAASGTVSPLQSMFGARRDTFVGLTGEWGTLRAGYLTTGFRGAVAKCDLAPGATGVSAAYEVFGFSANPGGSPAGATYFNRYNAVNYSTPVMSGFSASVNYLVDTAKSAANTTNQVDPGGWDLLARFETKLFHVTLVHTDLKDVLFGGQAAETNKADTFLAGVNFPTGTTVSVMYNASKSDLTPTPGAAQVEYKQTSYYVGVKQVVGQHEFMVNYQSADKTKKAGVDLANTSASLIGARYGFNVLKNVQVYGVYAKITNQVASKYNFNVGGVTGTAIGSDPQSVGLGLRLSF